MKRLLTLILTFILTLSGVFPAFAWNVSEPNNVVSTDNKTIIYPSGYTPDSTYVMVYKRSQGNTWWKTPCDMVLPVFNYKSGNYTYCGSEVSWSKKGQEDALWAHVYYNKKYHTVMHESCTAQSKVYLVPKEYVILGENAADNYGVYGSGSITFDISDEQLEYYTTKGFFATKGIFEKSSLASEQNILSKNDISQSGGNMITTYEVLFDLIQFKGRAYIETLKGSKDKENFDGAIYDLLSDLYSGTSVDPKEDYSPDKITQVTSYDKKYVDYFASKVLDLEGSTDSADGQQTEGDKGPVTPVEPEDETDINDEFRMWYQAAFKVMSGATDWTGFDEKYKDANNLIALEPEGGEYLHWQIVYDILSLAHSGYPSLCEVDAAVVKLSDWDKDNACLKQAYSEVMKAQKNDGGMIAGTDLTYEADLAAVVDALNASNGNDDMTRVTTIRQRLNLLFRMQYQGNVSADNTDYQWVQDFYSANNKVFARLDDLPQLKTPEDGGSKTLEPILRGNGTLVNKFPRLRTYDGDMPEDPTPYLISSYFIQTIWEVGYLRDYMIKDMNSAILNGTVMEHEQYYNMLKDLSKAVEEFGIEALTNMWEADTQIEGHEELQYKSLKALWEACQNDKGVQEHEASADTTVDETPQLSSSKPMPAFFENYTDSRKLSENYIKGLAYTATLVPMKSNLYSAEWLNYLDTDFRTNFYDLYGFNRKALYRDMTAGAGEEYFNSGEVSKGALELCTLRDLIESKGDIVLYLDDNFYNVEDIKSSQSVRPNYATTKPGTEEGTTEDIAWYSTIASGIEDTYNTNFDNIAKTNESSNYSKIYYNMMNNLDGAHTYYPEATPENPGNSDNAVLNSGKINYYLNPGQDGSEVYSPMQAYAVVSSVYRDGDLFNLANSMETHRPVFISSKTAAYAKGASFKQKCTLYNYALVMNLEESMPVGYLGNLDMDCPLYMDILGNIITESGTVIIPAMSNATLMNEETFVGTNWAAGLYAVYGNGYRIPVKKDDINTISQVMANFVEDESGKYYIPKARTLGDEYEIDMSRLATTSKETLDVLYNRAYADLKNATQGNIYNFNQFFQIALEVMRGAPIESIDKEAEGLLTNDRLDRAGIVAAVKLEDLNNSLGTNGENSTISMPSLAFMPGFNYVALMVFKLLLLVIIVVNMAIVYIDAVGGHLGLHTIWKCFSSMVITMLTVLTVPAVFEVTYYQSSKALLQKEATYISMLNLEKKESGVEIGVTEVSEPKIRTELFVKLEDISVPWYELFYNSIFTDSYKTLNEMYENYARKNAFVASEDDIVVKNDGVYVSVDSIYDSSAVDLNINGENSMRTLVQTAVDKNSTFSFYSPYYVILDALIQNVNYFNANPWGEDNSDVSSTEGWYAYTTKTQKGGRIKTMGLIEPYFTSAAFMESEGKDLTGMAEVYSDNIDTGYDPDPATHGMFAPMNLDAIRESYWYAGGGISATECTKRVEYLNEQARVFVADNKELLGKISDETFLKVMAMYLSTKHNAAFGAQKASALEIYNLSNDDLIRMSIADKADVMINSTLSYPRFVYAVGGTSGVFAAALLSMVMWISSIVKPVLIVVAFLTIFISVFVFKVCLRKQDSSLYGYVITTLLLCGTNILYSLLLKLSVYLPNIGATPFMCILLQIVVQIAYMVILLQVVGTAFKDWRDLGAQRYANKLGDWKVRLFQKFHKDKGNLGNPFYGGTTQKSDPEKNWNYYDEMMDERRKRSR